MPGSKMTNDDVKPFKQAVNSYYKSKNLSAQKLQVLTELTENIESDNSHKANTVVSQNRANIWTWSASAIAASLMIAIFTIGYQQQPEIITAAYEDTLKDAQLNNGFAQQQKDWIAVNQILPAPAQYQVEMSKFCDLGGQKTTHLRIAGQHQGKMNVFFKKGSQPYRFGKTSGKTNNMHWKVLESNKDITVIVMYSEDMREPVVNKIINNMLPDLVA